MHTVEVREKLKQAHVRSPRSGEKNGMYGRHHTDMSRDKMSETRSQMVVEGRYPTFGSRTKKGIYTSTKTGQEHFYRSGWELSTMQRLDVDASVVTWQYEAVRIPYIYDNHKRWYVPDFIITFQDGHREMWEVKSTWLLKAEKTMLKEEAARIWCQTNDVQKFEVITRG
jgi:hypothetical protein